MAQRSLVLFVIAAFAPVIAHAASYGGGAGTDFTFTNAADINGLFGPPIPTGNDLFFPFSTFSASADNTNPNVSVSDTLTMDVQANAGLRFDAVAFVFQGTHTISGTPGANSVQSNGGLTVTSLVRDPFFGSDSYTFFDDQPGAAGAFWAGDPLWVTIPLGTQVTELTLTLSQELIAIATDGGAQITAGTEIGPGVVLSVIPEPSSVALFGFGALGLAYRRKHFD